MMICLSSELAWDQAPLWGKNVKNGVKRHKKIGKRSKLSGGLGRETFDQSENETRI